MFRLEFCLPLQELIQSSIEVLQVFLILAHQVFGPLQSSSVVGLLNVTVNASIRLSMEDRPALLRSATRVFLSVMTERAATRAADCRHNRSCLRCNSRENHGSDGVPFLHEVLLSIIFRLNPVAAYRVKPILQACHSFSICQTRTFAQSVYRSRQPTAFADLISSTDLVREFRQLRRIVLARGQFAERLQFRTEAGTHVEPSFGEIELKTTGKSVSHKAPNHL